jgi:transcriptional regulator with XRE-family HTH domain
MRDRLIDPTKLVELRARRCLTMVDLAKTSGVSLSLIKYAESGQRQLSDRTAWAVANALGCRPHDFSKAKRRAKAKTPDPTSAAA